MTVRGDDVQGELARLRHDHDVSWMVQTVYAMLTNYLASGNGQIVFDERK